MPFHTSGGIRYLTFDLFDSGITHAVFTRQGGVSPDPWFSLNVGGTVGDDRERVIENRKRSFGAISRPSESIFDVWQVHSADVVCAEAARMMGDPYQKADVILTDRPEVTLFMRFADCVPVLLYDPVNSVVGLVHAGWLGTVRQAVSAAVKGMQSCYGTVPSNVQAGIGPSIGPDHYEIGADVVARVRETFGLEADQLLVENDGKIHFDLWAANKKLLEQSGVSEIEVAGICTACHEDDWYSHRAQRGSTGRFGALIAINL